MAITRMTGGLGSVRYLGLLLVAGLLTTLPIALAQQYPSAYQIFTDGTAVVVDDYASMPPSSLRGDAAYPAPINYSDQLGRPNSFRSEPSDAPLSATRFFVVDQNGTLYILDKATKKFTPYIEIGKNSFLPLNHLEIWYSDDYQVAKWSIVSGLAPITARSDKEAIKAVTTILPLLRLSRR